MFISDKFIFNGIHSDEMGVSLVTFDSNAFNPYGLSYNQGISVSKNRGDISHFVEENEEIPEIELNIALVDKYNNPIAWDDNTIIEITDWLITDSFVEFISEDNVDLVYYLKTKKIVKNFTKNKQGYLQVTLQPFSNLGYIKYNKKYVFNDKSSFIIDCLSTLKDYKPIIEVKNLGDNLNIITLNNETTGEEPFEIRGLDNGEIATIDSLMGTVYNEYKDNLLMKCNRKWLKLVRGRNKINVSGNVELCIKCQFPVRL